MGEAASKIYYKKTYSDNSKPKLSEVIKSGSENSIEFQGSLETGDGTKFTIKKESCSDGMSDHTYPFAIELMFDEAGVLNGCGRIK